MIKKVKRLLIVAGYYFERETDPQFQWGHPDEWSEAEWYFFNKEKR